MTVGKPKWNRAQDVVSALGLGWRTAKESSIVFWRAMWYGNVINITKTKKDVNLAIYSFKSNYIYAEDRDCY